MKWIEAKVVYEHRDKNLAADLISGIFYDLNLRGVVTEDPDIGITEDWAQNAIKRPAHHAVIGYFRKDHRTESRRRHLEKKLAQLKKRCGLVYRVTTKELDEEDWAESWKAYFEPQKIGLKIVVKPTWRAYRAAPGEIVLELDPGMAFGTGTHPTTALCVEMIEAYLKKGDSFLDVGTGSGILMVAAAKLGAGMLCGVDQDEAAVDIASQNLKLNRIAPQMFSVICGNLVEGIRNRYDFVVANILTDMIVVLLPGILKVLKTGGIFVCSGIMQENRDLIISKMEEIGFEIIEIGAKADWAAIAGRLKASGASGSV